MNADHTILFSENVGTMFFLHANYLGREIDHNKDGFIDKPMGYQVNFQNRWDFQREMGEGVSGYSIMLDERKGGQLDFHNKKFGEGPVSKIEDLL